MTPPWCPRLIAEFNASDQRAAAVVQGLTPEQLNWQPGPGEWSVGQCLDHLYVSNVVYGPPIASALVGQPVGVAQEITPGWFGRWFIRNYIAPSPQPPRRRAPRKIKPAAHVDPSILERFLKSNQDARELVQRAGNYDVNRIRFKNPFVPLIRFTVGTGLEILSKHEQRHLQQAERVRAALP